MPKKINLESIAAVEGSKYPQPYGEPCAHRVRRRLGDAAGLTQFGVNLTTLPAGAWSSQRHWHSAEDEFIYVLEGELTLITDEGEETLRAGDCTGFKAGAPDGHHVQNRTARDAVFLEVGARRTEHDDVVYPDIDLKVQHGEADYVHADGRQYDR